MSTEQDDNSAYTAGDESTPQENGTESEQVNTEKNETDSGDTDKATDETLSMRFFIGGLSPQTTQSHLLEYLSKFACVCNVDIKVDPTTGRNRGYGFFTVRKSPGFDQSILLEMKHTIDEKRVDIREFRKDASDKPYLKRKIFVGGVNPALAEDILWTHFSQFGPVETVSIIKDPYTGKNRGFAFVEFESEEGAARALAAPSHQLDDENRCDVRAAEQRPTGATAGRGRGVMYRPPGGYYDYGASRVYGGIDTRYYADAQYGYAPPHAVQFGAPVYAAGAAAAGATPAVAPASGSAAYYASPQYYGQQGYTAPTQAVAQSPYGYTQYGSVTQPVSGSTETYGAVRRGTGSYASRPY